VKREVRRDKEGGRREKGIEIVPPISRMAKVLLEARPSAKPFTPPAPSSFAKIGNQNHKVRGKNNTERNPKITLLKSS
jgi:hypothetical protein